MISSEALLAEMGERPRILVIRRDNIGDLVCTTPALTLLRRRFPAAHIAALVNSYNAPVLRGNPDVDEVFAYVKGKHVDDGRLPLLAWLGKLRLLRAIRTRRFDLAVLATAFPTPGWLRLARASGARHVLAAVAPSAPLPRGVDLPVQRNHRFDGRHAVEQTALLLAPLGIDETPPALTLRPGASAGTAANLPPSASDRRRPLIGLHISARKPKQRWPVERFCALMRALARAIDCEFALFWAPGAADDPRHAGDDDKAQVLARSSAGLPLHALPTRSLEELIAGLAAVDLLVCSDGGAMHLAAALGKPIICFFGNSDPRTWHPWGVPHRVLQPASEDVADVPVEQACAAVLELLDGAGREPRP
jgi:ADP-heptose:LPS heptosyltransferase